MRGSNPRVLKSGNDPQYLQKVCMPDPRVLRPAPDLTSLQNILHAKAYTTLELLKICFNKKYRNDRQTCSEKFVETERVAVPFF